jgi:hypothetical protein
VDGNVSPFGGSVNGAKASTLEPKTEWPWCKKMWWDTYNLFRGFAFQEFWRDYLKSDRNLLFIVGQGFDPRVLGPLSEIILVRPDSVRRCIALDLSESYETDNAALALRTRNTEGLADLFPNGALESRRLAPSDADGIRNVSRNAAVLLSDIANEITRFTDVILDISALPRLVYLTILNQLLSALVANDRSFPLGSSTNLHVVYAESAPLDMSIVKKEVDVDLAPIQNLTIRLDEEASERWPLVWFPVLAEDASEQLIRIWERINPDDVCPVIPIQSANPRRGDNIIRDLGELVFDRFQVDPRDIIHATEWNPFQLYRSLLSAMARYEETLRFLGGSRFVVSPLSSKSLSIGCLLGCFEKRLRGSRASVRVGMAHVESRRYEAAALNADVPAQPISLWLTGDCYARDK